MARTSASAAASRIRIEDEVWEDAFSTRVPARRGRTSAAPSQLRSVSPARPVAPAPARRIAEPPNVRPDSLPPAPVRAVAPEQRRTVRIQGRGADPFRSDPRGWDDRFQSDFPRAARSAHRPSPVVRSLSASPDRLAMWAAMLGFLLVVVALLSSHF